MPLGVFVACMAVYTVSPVRVQSDSIWSIPIAVSLMDRGDINLDEFSPTAARSSHGVIAHDGHLYGYFPLGASLVAWPLLAMFDGLVSLTLPVTALVPTLKAAADRWRTHVHAVGDVPLRFYETIENIIASLLVSASAVVVYLTARRRVRQSAALVVTLLYALGTNAYSTASRVLWQHAPSVLVVSLAVWLLSRGVRAWAEALALGLLAGFGFICRPTNGVLVVAGFVYLLVTQWRFAVAYVIGGVLVAVPFCWHSLHAFSAVVPPYFAGDRLEAGSGSFAEALLGNLISPARGLLVFSPVVLLAVGGLVAKAAARRVSGAELTIAAIVVAHWVVISSFPHWWAGHCFGPRFFTDVLPCLAFFLAEPVQQALNRPRGALWIALVVTGATGIAIHTRGSISAATHSWNDGPPNVDDAPARVWSWSDLQFLRGL